MIQWLGQEGPTAPKHSSSWAHPIAACLLFYIVVLSITFALHDLLIVPTIPYLEQLQEQSIQVISRTNAVTISNFCASYATWLLFWRLYVFRKTAGSVAQKAVLYEYTWLCNSTLIVGAIALRMNKPIVVGSYCIAVSIDQSLWYADLVGWAFSGFNTFPIGVAKYITWPETTWLTRITCSHHLWTIPLLLYGCGNAALHWSSFPCSVFIVTMHVCLSRWLTPFVICPPVASTRERGTKTIVNRLGFLEPEKYLNVNLSHDVWKDVKFEFLQICHDNPSTGTYLFRLLWRWQMLNLPIYLILCYIAKSMSSETPLTKM